MFTSARFRPRLCVWMGGGFRIKTSLRNIKTTDPHPVNSFVQVRIRGSGIKISTYPLTLQLVIVCSAQGQGRERRPRGCRRARGAAGGPESWLPLPRGVCVAMPPRAAPPPQPLRRPGRCARSCCDSRGGHRPGLLTAHCSALGVYLGRKKTL